MAKRVAIACYEVPGWGGASTAAYAMFQGMKAAGTDVCLINVVGEHDAAFFAHAFGAPMGNPLGLDGVHNCVLNGNNYHYQPAAHDLIEAIDPDVILAVGWIAAFVMKTAQPSRRLIYLTTGCGWMGAYVELFPDSDYLSVTEAELRRRQAITEADQLEERAIEMSDLVVAHSDINLLLYRSLYPGHQGKMHDRVIWLAAWIRQDADRYADLVRPFAEREVDVLFCANDWNRPVKGWRAACRIMQALEGLRIHVVGEPGPGGLPGGLPGCLTGHGFMADRRALFRLMGNARVVVCPSRFDAAPGLLFEADRMGCNVVASRNCGNWALCHPDLLVDPPVVGEYAARAERAVKEPFRRDHDPFGSDRSAAELEDLLAVF